MRFAALLFDLDGTLVDTPAGWVESCLATLAAERLGVERSACDHVGDRLLTCSPPGPPA